MHIDAHATQVIGVQECMVMDSLKEALLDHVGRDTYMWWVFRLRARRLAV